MHNFDPTKTAPTGSAADNVQPRNPETRPVAPGTPKVDSLGSAHGKPLDLMLLQDQTLNANPVYGAPPEVPGYRIVEELGRGGMGVVYKAVQAGLDRVVALKMILGHNHDEITLHRFADEAIILGKLHHPHIVQIFEYGEHLGMPFLALEYIAGGSMADRLQGHPIPAAAAARVCQTLAETMAHAHEHGIVHRDLKPGNVLLATRPRESDPAGQTAPSGSYPRAGGANKAWWLAHLKITDFGLAKRPRDVKLTASNEMLGTPCYMAPEQAFGRTADVGASADTYALGAILYELLTGRPPFVGATVLHVLDLLGTEDPIPPRRLHPGLPQDLETICLKCLEKEPSRRYPTVKDLAEELGRFIVGEPIHARPISHLERASLVAAAPHVSVHGIGLAVGVDVGN